jgi:alkylation response protein AidB-like acyl-CoA dehydrogenase
LADAGEHATAAALAARVAAADAAGLATDEGIQIHGGFGYTVEYHVERHYRDSRTIDVLDGGSDSMRDRLAKLHFGG